MDIYVKLLTHKKTDTYQEKQQNIENHHQHIFFSRKNKHRTYLVFIRHLEIVSSLKWIAYTEYNKKNVIFLIMHIKFGHV